MSHDSMAQLEELLDLVLTAQVDPDSIEAQTIEVSFRGDVAEALGSARHTADLLRDHGVEATAEYVGRGASPDWSEAERHRCRIHVKPSASS